MATSIFYLGYWGVHDGLSTATVLPHLRLLSALPNIDRIVYCSIEREAFAPVRLDIDKVQHIPLLSGSTLADKWRDITQLPAVLAKIARNFSLDRMICRGAPAGSLGYLVHRRLDIPYYVESFEPHADYMHASGVWPKWHPKYLLEKYWEERQKRTAQALLPVSNNYGRQLQAEGVEQERVKVVPCSVSAEQFAFCPEQRAAVRLRLGIPMGARLGVYVGKFGGIYYEREALRFFREAFAFWPGFRLLVLTPQPEKALPWLLSAGLPAARVFCLSAPHAQIPAYLSAADMAFSLIRPAQVRRFCSPIKNGEYWANGLPILLPEQIGDDSDIVAREGNGGVVFDLHQLPKAFAEMEELLCRGDRESRALQIAPLARQHRSIELAQQAYRQLFD